MHNTLSDMVLDLVQNSIEAQSQMVILDYIRKGLQLSVFISDNGKGMDEETLKNAVDPFYTDGHKHKNRKVGLGLPFLKQTCESSGGKFEIDSRKGEGTSVFMDMDLANIDCPPEGNRSELFMHCMLFEGDHDFVINCRTDDTSYSIVKSDLMEALGAINDSESLVLLKKYITSLEEN